MIGGGGVSKMSAAAARRRRRTALIFLIAVMYNVYSSPSTFKYTHTRTNGNSKYQQPATGLTTSQKAHCYQNYA